MVMGTRAYLLEGGSPEKGHVLTSSVLAQRQGCYSSDHTESDYTSFVGHALVGKAERALSPICWLTPQMATIAGAGPI